MSKCNQLIFNLDIVTLHLIQVLSYLIYKSLPHPTLHSFPTRRSSDLNIIYGYESELPPLDPKNPGHYHPESSRSEEYTSELQSRGHLVCRLLLEKKKEYVVWIV